MVKKYLAIIMYLVFPRNGQIDLRMSSVYSHSGLKTGIISDTATSTQHLTKLLTV